MRNCLVYLAFIIICTTVAEESCLPGWTQFQAHCYQMSNWTLIGNCYKLWWPEQAEYECNLSGADLVSIHSAAELDFVNGLIKSNEANDDKSCTGNPCIQGAGVYTGLQSYADTVTWTDNSPVDFKFWGALPGLDYESLLLFNDASCPPPAIRNGFYYTRVTRFPRYLCKRAL